MAIEDIKKLKELNLKKQLTFAFLACERVLPNYIYFTKNYNFGDADILRDAIDFVYSSILHNDKIDGRKIERFLTLIYNNTPNTNDFTTFYATIAMYSGGVIYESINLLKNIGVDKILADISTMATDAIDCFIQERDNMDYDDENFEEKILNDKIMQNEIAIQKGVIEYLCKVSTIDRSDLDLLLKLQENKKSSLII